MSREDVTSSGYTQTEFVQLLAALVFTRLECRVVSDNHVQPQESVRHKAANLRPLVHDVKGLLGSAHSLSQLCDVTFRLDDGRVHVGTNLTAREQRCLTTGDVVVQKCESHP